MAEKTTTPELTPKAIETAAKKTTEAAPKATSSALVSFFLSVFLPILPGLLITAAPKILKNPKFLDVLDKVDEVIDQIREQGRQ